MGVPFGEAHDAFGKGQLLEAQLLPKLKPVGLEWANFQVMRRTHSSLPKELDVDPHVRAEQMGHTVDVNENVYTITSLKPRKEAVNALEKEIGA
jgi:hypothetical protein